MSVASADEVLDLYSLGAGPCVIATFYDRLAKKGGLIHVDDGTDLPDAFSRLSDKLGTDKLRIEIKLLGGHNINFLVQIADALFMLGLTNINEAGFSDWNRCKNIALSLDDGAVSDIDIPQSKLERREAYTESHKAKWV